MSKIVVEEVRLTKIKNLGYDNYLIDLSEFSKIKTIRPGQFVHLKIPGGDLFFRRAFSVYDVDLEKKQMSIMFKIFGRGTTIMSKLKPGVILDLLGPLGNGFEYPSKKDRLILAAGGVGMPPIYFLAKKLLDKGYDAKKMSYYYGGASRGDLVDLPKIKKLGIKVICSTDDGSYGVHGFVTDAIRENVDFKIESPKLFACGPEGMLEAIDRLGRETGCDGQISLEAPMPCGIGICLGCIRPLRKGGYTRVCREGPVYNIGEVAL